MTKHTTWVTHFHDIYMYMYMYMSMYMDMYMDNCILKLL